ncbi:hypothetical protein DPMN_028142 [Dreissena polymorpha]|uniref:Uncharacterized protein n=1 Tax=Dreissena polymorpha TaxID=45954 RepID=A0A9D4LUV9_DREPO|nr:hypothetical protein DPMN_028142 [Dreissena polymorpha]
MEYVHQRIEHGKQELLNGKYIKQNLPELTEEWFEDWKLEDILEKLENIYGDRRPGEYQLADFYRAKQRPDENSNWGSCKSFEEPRKQVRNEKNEMSTNTEIDILQVTKDSKANVNQISTVHEQLNILKDLMKRIDRLEKI